MGFGRPDGVSVGDQALNSNWNVEKFTCQIAQKAIKALELGVKFVQEQTRFGAQRIIMAVEFTDANFEELALNSDKPVVVDFWAEWCGPCRMVGPVVEELSNDYDGRAVVGKVNVDLNSDISMKFGIRNIPTIIFLKGGELVDKSVGAVPKNVLVEKLEALL